MQTKPRTTRHGGIRRAVCLVAALALTGCTVPPPNPDPGGPVLAPAPAPTSLTPVAPPVAALPTPAAFSEALGRAAERLLQDAQGQMGSGPRELVIDPLIDSSTGQQTAGTVQMGQQLSSLIRTRVPNWNVRPLSRTSLANRPLLLIGTLTAINAGNAKTEPADAFRICLVLIDLRSGKLVAKRVDRATAGTVDAEPTALFRDSPTWALDTTAVAYIKSCQGSSPGDSIDPGYLLRLPAAAIINEATIAFNDNKLADAYRLFHEARPIADPGDLRVLNGLYLSSWKTGKRKEAAETFGRIVAVGLETRKLPVKMFFSPGGTTLLRSADHGQYAIWMHELAGQIVAREACVRVVGHTSRTGDASANEALSLRRAQTVKVALEKQSRKIAPRLAAAGVGARENLIGLGTDDLRDALDRRVEFRAVDCG
ncbi:MAG: OmpA family protein [Pseudomonadota bacterium]|nr:OmpA family protein [Pseudomonadota bacterium]